MKSTKETNGSGRNDPAGLIPDSMALATIFERMNMGVIYCDETGRIIHANPAALQILGLTYDTITGRHAMDDSWKLFTEDMEPFPVEQLPAVRTAKTGESLQDVVMGVMNPEEQALRWLKVSSAPLVDKDSGEPMRVLITLDDITRLKLIEKQLRENEQRYRLISENVLDLVALHDPEGRYEYVSPSVTQLLGYKQEELIGTNPYILFHPDDQKRIREESHDAALNGQEDNLIEYRIRTKDGPYRWFETNTKPIFDDDGNLVKLQTLSRDISARKQYESKLQLANKVFESTIEGIVVTDAEGVIEFVNPGFTTITGYQSEEVIGRNPNILKSGMHTSQFYRSMWQQLITTGSWQGEVWNRRKNGESYPEWLSINAIRDEEGITQQYAAVFYDMSEIKRSQEKVEYQANYDALTGLANRNLMLERLEHALALRKRNPAPLALLFIDLDNFKTINDSLGHGVGDLYLKEIAGRLQNMVRLDDTVVRLGGDEFLIILESMETVNEAVSVAKRVLDALKEPVESDSHELVTSASIGIACYPDDATTPEALIKAADMAMYKAKESGKNNFHTYTSEMNQIALERMEMESSLRRAIDEQNFELYYQPLFDLSSDAIIGLEALLRWRRADGTIVVADDFVDIADDTALILPIGEWAINNVFSQMRAWRKDGIAFGRLSLNVSWRQLERRAFVADLMSMLAGMEISPHELQLEITEKTIVRNAERALSVMKQLAEAGISIALDDFGTGFSSLSTLKEYPINTLKIDKSFLEAGRDDEKSRSIIRATVGLGHALSLQVVTEGIEDGEQLAFLRRTGCDAGQGFHLGEPVPPELVPALFDRADAD